MDLLRFWKADVGDNATLTSPPAGYVQVGREAFVLPRPWVEFGVTRTVPLKVYYSQARGDHITLATAETEAAARAAGYTFLGEIGHVWPVEPRHYARALKQYWSPQREDNILVGSVEGERAAIAAGYVFVRVEGWAGPQPQFHPWPGGIERTDPINRVFDADYSGLGLGFDVELISWGRLRAGDTLRDMHGEHGGIITNQNTYRDVIHVTEEPIEPGQIEFVLELGTGVSWWKEMALLRRDLSVVEAREAEGDRRRVSMRFRARDIAGHVLRLSKAKSLGERVPQYALVDLTAKTGRRVTFRWLQDDADRGRRSLALQMFHDRQAHGDVIRVTSAPGPDPRSLQVVLFTSRRATWFKQLKLLRSDRSEGPSVSIQDRPNGSVTMTIPNHELDRSRILMTKAMFLGVHTDVYEIGDLGFLAGRTLQFEWLRDDIPDPHASTVLEWRAGFRAFEEHWGIRTFDGVRCDGDVIRPVVEDLGPGREHDLEFVVATSGPVDWWKALKLLNIFDDLITEVTVEGRDQRSAPISGRFEEFWWADLVFAKAKFLGKREDKYEYQLGPRNLAQIGAAPGKRVVFQWSRDDLPRPEGC